MWSYEVSDMVGSFQQQAFQGAGYANSIGMMSPGFAGNIATGMGMNAMGAVAGPAATLGMGLLGADPISMGMRAGIAAFPAMGAGGALAAGVGVAAPIAMGMYGAHAVGSQIFSGMQQQQQLNMGIRGSIGGFMNQGQGPSGADMALIGNQIRSMTHQQGAGGEVHGFQELSSLAQNMGQMGFAQKAQDVRQFSTKFKEMVETLKGVARDLGTTLESAQQAVVGMRGSGIFSTADQLKMSQSMRNNAVTGNIAMGESSAMASIGSQIARSIGGQGRAGAFGGVKTLGQIGQAMQMGVIDEESIYNATGLTGAEGQRAMATSMMESGARFLKSNRGRFMLAAMADPNGQINEDALDEFMSGNMGVGRTRQLAAAGLGRTGRADFLRNEGRLASSLLEKVGGNVGVMSLMGWAGKRGIDIENMGDREMLFAQRQLGMGRDQLEDAVKMVRKLPEMRDMARMREGQDDYLQKVKMQQSQAGLEGVKNSFNSFKEKVQGSLQKVGQDIYNDASNYVEKYIRSVTGETASAMTDQIDEAYMRYRAEGGLGGKGTAQIQNIARNARNFGISGQQLLKDAGGASGYAAYRGYAQKSGFTGALLNMMGGKSLEERTGYKFHAFEGQGTADEQLAKFKQRIDLQREGATTPADDAMRALTSDVSSGLSKSAALKEKLAGASGDDYLRVMGEAVTKYGSPEMRKQWSAAYMGGKADPRLLGQLAQTISGGADLPASMQFVGKSASPFNLEGGAYATESDRLKAYGKAMFSGSEIGETEGQKATGIAGYAAKGAAGGAAVTGPLASLGAMAGGLGGAAYGAYQKFFGSEAKRTKSFVTEGVQMAAARYLRTDKGREILGNLQSGTATAEQVDSYRKRMNELIANAGTVDKMDDEARAEYESLRTGITTQSLVGVEGKTARQHVVSSMYTDGMSLEDFERQSAGMSSALGAEGIESIGAIMKRGAGISRGELEKLRASGVYDPKSGKLTEATAKSMAAFPKLASVVQNRIEAMRREVNGEAMGVTREGLTTFDSADESRRAAQTDLYSMSSAELGKAIAAVQKGEIVGGDRMLGELRSTKGGLDRMQRGIGRRGSNLTAVSELGIEGLNPVQIRDIRGAKSGEAVAERLKGMGYDLSEGGTEKLREAVDAMRSAGGDPNKLHAARAKLGEVSEEVKEKQKDMRRKAQEESDPLLADIKGILNRMATAMEAGKNTPKNVTVTNLSDIVPGAQGPIGGGPANKPS